MNGVQTHVSDESDDFMNKIEWIDGTIHDVRILPLHRHEDERGFLCEAWRQDDDPPLPSPAMAYLSVTKPGQVRGPHEHRKQTDVFVFAGPGNLELVLWDNRSDSPSYGVRWIRRVGETNPARVVVPPGVVHGYRNGGDADALVLNLPDRLYGGSGRNEMIDEIRHERNLDSPFRFPEEPRH